VGHDLIAVDRQLAGERDERRPVEVGLGDAGHEIRRAGAECGEARARPAGAAGHRLGHEGGAGLVLREHELEARSAEALDQVDDLPTRMAEDVTDARGVQPLADEPRDGRHPG
jgi:hypothetical protein